jgi:hypothetical protein
MITDALTTAGARTDIVVAVDDDDPDAAGYAALEHVLRGEEQVLWRHGPRDTMAGWTNTLAEELAPRYFALGSFGDDHHPRTLDWDTEFLGELSQPGIILAWGDDKHQHGNLPTAPLIRSAVVTALGWMCLPGVASKYCDDAWKALAGPYAVYRPDVIIEHVHPDAGKAPLDATYRQGNAHWASDEATYRYWLRFGLADDAETARKAAAGS